MNKEITNERTKTKEKPTKDNTKCDGIVQEARTEGGGWGVRLNHRGQRVITEDETTMMKREKKTTPNGADDAR